MWLNIFNLVAFTVVGIILLVFALNLKKIENPITDQQKSLNGLRELVIIVGIFLLCIAAIEMADLFIFKTKHRLSHGRK